MGRYWVIGLLIVLALLLAVSALPDHRDRPWHGPVPSYQRR